MERNRSSPRPSNLLPKIRDFARSIVFELCNGRSPVISIKKFRTYCTNSDVNCLCSSNLPTGIEMLTLRKQSHAHRTNVLLRVLLIVQQLLQENKHASKRDIFYTYPSIFSDQSVVDRAINDICILFECSRHNLNVVSVAKGFNRCIVITGRGYPDIPTRRFLRLLTEKLCIPVYGLVDSDPYGFDILTTYRFGSLEMAYNAELLRIPEICWVGAFTSDSDRYELPSQCLLPLSTEDKKRIKAILSRCYLKNELQWRLELQMMLEKGVKFEIEALSVHSLSYLSEEYLPSKIKEMD